MNILVSIAWLPCLGQLDGLGTGSLLGGILGLDGGELLKAALTSLTLWSWSTLGTGILN